MAITSDNQHFWQMRYQQQQTPWDLGRVAPPLAAILEEKLPLLRPGKMAVLGCGYGHDAAYFGQHGFDVTGFDIVPEAVAHANVQYGQCAHFVEANLWDLPKAYEQSFDFVLEHTCFCAILPEKRAQYVEVVRSLLKPGGVFLGLIWAFMPGVGGPPFSSSLSEIQKLFSPYFDIQMLSVATQSVSQRKDQELLCLFRLC